MSATLSEIIEAPISNSMLENLSDKEVPPIATTETTTTTTETYPYQSYPETPGRITTVPPFLPSTEASITIKTPKTTTKKPSTDQSDPITTRRTTTSPPTDTPPIITTQATTATSTTPSPCQNVIDDMDAMKKQLKTMKETMYMKKINLPE